MSYLCIKKQEPTAGAKGIMCGGVFLPIESYESEHPTPASQIPSEGLTLYVPLSEAPNASEWTGYGSITYKTVDGVPCAYFNGDNGNGLYMEGKAFETQTFTVSIVFNTKSFSPTSGYMPYLVNFGPSSTSDNDRLALRFDNYYAGNKNALAMVYYGVYLLVQNLSKDTWYSAQMKFDGNQISLYLNGELQSQLNVSAKEIKSGVWIGKSPSNDGAFNGYLSSLRVYNRALSDAEIALLAREFVFNSAPLAGRKGLLVPVGESVVAPPANGLVFNASYAEDMTDSDGESPVDGTGYTIVEDAAGFKCLNVEKSNMQDSMYYDGTQEKMQFGTGNFAVGFYFKSVKPWSDYNGVILATKLSDGNSGAEGFVFYKNRASGRKSMVVRYADSSQQEDFYSSSDVDTNWHHWMFMRAGNTLRWYKDGILDAERGYTGGIGASANLNVGGYYYTWSDSTSAYFRLSNVRIYNRALTDAEIQSVACEHNPSKKMFIPLQTAYGTPQAGQKGIIVRSSQVVGYAAYSKSSEAMPTDGLVFHAPLSEESSTAETGQALTKTGTITYETLAGIPCITKGDTDAYLSALLSVEGVLTLSFWIKTTYTGEYIGMAYVGGLCIFDTLSNSNFQFSAKKNYSERVNFQGISKPLKWRDGAWHHMAMSITSTESKLYRDGTLISTASGVNISTSSHTYIGWDNDGDNAAASYAQFRIFNRALTDAEIKTLAGEYKPEEVKKMFIAVKEQSAIPADGLVFYASLSEEANTAETGQALTKNGTITYQTYKGIQCAHFSYAYISSQFSDYVTPYPMTFAIWAAPDTTDSLSLWSFENDKPLMYWHNRGEYHVYAPDCNVSAANVGDWHHIAWSINSDRSSTYYFDGVAMGTTTSNNTSTIKSLCIGYRNGEQPNWLGYLAGFRIYNRALTDTEIKTLSGEYKREEVKKMFIAVKEQSAIPADGLVFYASLSEEANTAETGQALTKNGTITYQTYKGIQCAHFSYAYISSQFSDYVTPYPMTFAIWAAPDTTDSLSLWSFENDKPLMYWHNRGEYHVYAPDCNVSAANVGDWHHIAWSINSDRSSTYYFDGVAMGTTTSNNTSTIKSLCIGYRNGEQPNWLGYLAGFRIYNRALSGDEISALANEYTLEA